jgi:uncharacterized delta-60 repeat protein
MKQFYFLCLAFIIISNSSSAQAGNLDSSFGTNGQLITDLHHSQEYLTAAALQPDGKIIAGGSSGFHLVNTLVRYKTDGTPDRTFGINGASYFEIDDFGSQIYSVAIQPDGKIIATGVSLASNQNNLTVLRFEKNGIIDSSFGKNGIVFIGMQGNDIFGKAIAIQPDGKIIVAGTFVHNDLSNNYEAIIVARLKPDGQLDSTYNGIGLNLLRSLDYNSYATSLVLLPDGKMFVGGGAFKYAGDAKFIVVKTTSSGALDSTFGKKGIGAVSFTNIDYSAVNAMGVQANGKIILGGFSQRDGLSEDFVLVRFNANGSVDNFFGTNGASYTDFGKQDNANALLIQTDGRIVAVGSSHDTESGESYFALARYNKNGSLDASFRNQGKLLTSFANFDNKKFSYANAALLQPDGKIIALGGADVIKRGQNVFALARYLGDVGNMQSGMQKNLLQNNVIVYPNPANNLLRISGLTNASTILTITDIAGNVFKKVSTTEESYLWNVADLRNGYYYLIVESRSDKTSIPFIKE